MTLLFRRHHCLPHRPLGPLWPSRRRALHGVPRDLSAHLMRDIGLEPGPDRHARLPANPLW